MYTLTIDNTIKAMLLFVILQVGEAHNRFYVMGIGEELVRALVNNIPEAMELHELLKQQYIPLERFGLEKSALPAILQSDY